MACVMRNLWLENDVGRLRGIIGFFMMVFGAVFNDVIGGINMKKTHRIRQVQ